MFIALRSALASALVFAFAGVAGSEDIAWSRYAEEGTVKVTTTDEDGSPRETKIWLVVVGGQGYIRTAKTRWGANLERDPEIVLRVGSDALPLRVEFVTDEATRDEVIDAFRDKYGFTDRIVNPFRGRNPKIMRLLPRSQ
jgi:hypothetical protein